MSRCVVDRTPTIAYGMDDHEPASAGIPPHSIFAAPRKASLRQGQQPGAGLRVRDGEVAKVIRRT